jgi:cytochrome c peroxidase
MNNDESRTHQQSRSINSQFRARASAGVAASMTSFAILALASSAVGQPAAPIPKAPTPPAVAPAPAATPTSTSAAAAPASASASTPPAARPTPPPVAMPSAKNPTHGALSMPEQQKLATPWLQHATAVTSPAGIGPEFWRLLVPAGNPGNEAQVALGRKLYFEPRLSKDGTVACATCHDVSRGFADHRNTAEGVGDQIGHRNAPTTLNAFLYSTQFWDGRAPNLEEQAKLPIVNPIEMGMADGKAAAAAIAADPEYQR